MGEPTAGLQAVGLPEVQAVGEYEARYGAYDRRQHQRPPQQQQEEEISGSPRIFRSQHKKNNTSTRGPASAYQV